MRDLGAFQACLWDVTSAGREAVAVTRQLVGDHDPSAARVETCQRFEVYSDRPCNCPAPLQLRARDALQHLAEVAAGLHAAVPGESQVMGQVRSGLAAAGERVRHVGAVGVSAARELRREADLNADVGRLLDRALDHAGIPSGGTILILGTGHQARATLRRAELLSFERIVIAGRSEPPSTWFDAGRHLFQPLSRLSEAPAADVLVGCLGEAAGELELGAVAPLPRSLVVDLGTPRNFAGRAPVAHLTIKDLLEASPEDQQERERLQARLAEIVERRIEMVAMDSTSAVGAFRSSVEAARRSQLPRLRRLHPEVPEETLDAITRSLINQLFHAPSQRLREMDDPHLSNHIAGLFAAAHLEAELSESGNRS